MGRMQNAVLHPIPTYMSNSKNPVFNKKQENIFPHSAWGGEMGSVKIYGRARDCAMEHRKEDVGPV